MNDKKKQQKPKYFIQIEGDDNADWIKLVNDGKSKQADLEAHDNVEKQLTSK